MSAIPRRLNPSDYSIDELRDRRDLAIRDGDTELAMACAIAIDKKRGFYGHRLSTPGGPATEKGRTMSDQSTITLLSGKRLTPEEAQEAIDEAMGIIEAVGTTGICYKEKLASQWMAKYYPLWQD